MPKCILTEQGGKGGGGGSLELISIEVTSQPRKKEYLAGDRFNPLGLVVTASYGMNGLVLTTTEIQGYTVTPDTLTDGTTELIVTYSEGGKVCTAKITDIVVIHKLLNITIDTHLGKTIYEYGDTLITDNYVVTASYSDSKTDNVSSKGVTYTPTELNVVNLSFLITVKYTEHQVEVSTTFNVIVNKKTITNLKVEPDTILVSSNGGTGQVTFSGDGTASLQESSFTPEIPTITLSKISDGNYTINVTGDGKTAISEDEAKTLTINVADSTNYTYNPNYITVKITALYWTWGEETAEGDEEWWNGLANFLRTNTNELIAAAIQVGKKKHVTLSSSVQGTTGHNVMVIGVNEDADKTITFLTENCLASTMSLFGSNANWIGSYARDTVCKNYYDNFPGKAVIKTLSKNTCTDLAGNNSLYNDEQVFFPSIAEMGLDTYSYAPATDEYTLGKSKPYSYYTDNGKRIKKNGDSGSALWYWTRSRYTYYSTTVCVVYTGGAANNYNYNSSNGRAAPAFAIG